MDAFAHLYSAENLNAFLDEHKVPSAFARALTDGRHIFRVAEEDGQLVGYCKIGRDITLDLTPEWQRGIELKELYLRANVQNRGVGAALMDWALAEAHKLAASTISLSVWSENFGAQRFYQRYGFAHIGDTTFVVGDHIDAEFLYGLKLNAGTTA
jgi:diamine N-acetyltransferase